MAAKKDSTKGKKPAKKAASKKEVAVSIDDFANLMPPTERTANGTFAKGHAPLGPPAELKELRKRLKGQISQLLVDEFDVFKNCMAVLAVKSPKSYCKVYVDMMAYSLPKISTIAFGSDEDGTENSATALLKSIAQYKDNSKQ